MAQKRGERRMREIMFGPVAKPEGLGDIAVLQEGDESQVVEGTARIVEDEPGDGLPDMGNCPAHDVPWKVEEFHGRIRGSHFVQGEPWCKLDQIYGKRFAEAYAAQFGEAKKEVRDAWLKNQFNSRTWSMMDASQHMEAVRLLTMPPVAATDDVQAPPKPKPSDTPAEPDDAPESSDRPSNAELDLEVEREQKEAERVEH